MAPVLSCRKVGFTYRNQSMAALTDVDLDVSPGELVSLAGPHGAGKSTLVRCASGIVPQMLKGRFSGQVLVKGRPVSETRVAELAGVVGTVFQDFENQLFSTNVRLEMAFGMENIGLDRPTMIERIDQVAARVGLGHLMNREPHSLSGGQKQRLALATVLCVRPELLLADEPTTDLDPIGKGRIFEILAHLKAEGHGLLLVEHDSEHLIESDRVVLLHAGQVTEDGPPAGVLADPATCYRHGIFPPQLFELFARLNLPERPCSIDAAQTALVHHGFRPVAESGPADPPLPEAPLIRLENVVYSYSGGPPVLDALSLDIREGDFLALLGANGSGKTTLVKHLNGL
ncbi:MAG: ATP-binding cassette domain-containing protein, partial [Proteobacteria bacterium]|nr:ATP-binding cassette domain-containing protein [Pseudomonadota bacterium]